LDAATGKIAPGGQNSIAELIARHEVAVRLYAAKIAPRPDMAEDIAQKAFVIAIQKCETFDAARSFPAWMQGIVRNVVRNEWEHLALHSKVERDTLAAYVETLASMPSDLEQLEHAQLRLQAMKKCIERLPERARQIVHLHYEMELACAVIASKIGTSVHAVKMALVRLRQDLRQCIQARLSGKGL
jgi:RNA polymerase sigma-70 factor, ECF subfamily